tara:strand:- start:1666 stop:4233 length:2568 start_codon:yes stop_codon:yes gene_type:complete
MSLIEFCNRNNIEYQPARICVVKKSNGDIVKQPVKYKEINEFPKNIDFSGGMSQGQYVERKPASVFEERRKYTNNYPHLCIDTCFIHQVDVDFTEDKYDSYSDESKKFITDLCKIAPYFKSMTKKHGKHIFIKTTKPLTDLGFSRRPQLIFEDIEVLSGMWSYADKLQIVENADFDIPIFPIEKYIKDSPTKKKIKISKKIKNAVIKTEPMQEELKLNDSWSNQKKCIFELSNLLNKEYFTEYDYWTRTIWSLANYINYDDDKENLLDIAHHVSKKCQEKYDEDSVNKLFTNTYNGSTIATFYYYVKQSNLEEYYKIKCKYFLLDNDLLYLGTDDCLADIFLENEGINYVVKTLEGKLWLYTYNGNVWTQDSNSHHQLNCKIRSEIRSYLYKINEAISKKYDNEIASCNDEERIEYLQQKKASDFITVQNYIIKVCGASKVKGIAEVVLQKLACRDFDEIEFDKNGYIFTFKNKCFCLKTFEEIKTNREDYILTTTGYKHVTSSKAEKEELDNLLNTIFPNKEVKDHYIKVMCSALYGVRLEKFFIANGNGGNGKGVINELLGETLGNYYYKGNSESFTKPLKEGNNPQVANMHNKRLVIIQEVESDNKRLNGTVIKELTGGNKINTRANYSNITQITILATFILECNKKPKIDGRIDESYARRLDDIPFESTFTDKEYLLNAGLDNVFKANTKYKDDKFREDFKNVLFNYLLDYMKNYMKETNKLITEGWKSPKIILDRTAEYLESSDDVKEWFNTKYNSISNEYTTIKDKVENGCFVECKLVYQEYKESQYFNLLTKKQKREQNLKWFYAYMKENINFKVYYKEKYTIGNKTYRNILLDHEEKPIIDDEEEDI